MPTEQKTTLENFSGFEDKPSHDFFGETVVSTSEETEVEKVISALEKDTLTDEKKQEVKLEAAAEKLVNDQFKEFEEGDKDDDDDIQEVDLLKDKSKVKPEDKAVKIGNKDTIEFLKEKGLLNYELEEGTVLTEDLAQEILEDNWEDSIQAGVEETIKDLPEAVKDLVRFASKGGNVTELLSTMSSHARTGLDKDSDMSVESNQILAVTLDLESQEYDLEDIASQIEFLKDSGKLENFSSKAYKKLIAKQEVERKSNLAKIEDNKAKTRATQKKYKEELTDHLNTVDNFKGLVINKKDKENLPSYIADIKVPLQNGTTVSKFQADLFAILGDKSKLIGLAKLVNSDFDFTSISDKTITQYSRDAKAKIEGADKINIKGSSASSQKQKKSLADLLD